VTSPPQLPHSDRAAGDDLFVAPKLTEVQSAAVEALRADGIAVLDFRSLLGEELWDEALADVQPFIRETEESTRNAGDRPSGKDELIIRRFLTRVGTKADGKKPEKPRFSISAPWLRIAAAAPLVDVVNSYRRQLTRLYEVDEWYTVPYPQSSERIASQQWHRDPEDVHVVKVFVYFTDVDDEAGPFEYVRGSAEGGRHGHLWPWADGHRYVPAEELEPAVSAEDRLTVTAPAGTMFLADTGGFHRGGFARERPRVLSTSTYLSPDTKKRRFKVDYTGQQGSLPAQVKFALG
jgi:Phytanoyl-CoA dioxygenase (PhyH)